MINTDQLCNQIRELPQEDQAHVFDLVQALNSTWRVQDETRRLMGLIERFHDAELRVGASQ